MKRVLVGGLTVLSAVVLPLSGIASAASTVDYEKSVGQVDGADTINWVVEATNDGGYVVGGQTVACYRYSDSVHAVSAMSYIPENAVRVSMQECVDNMNSGRKGGTDQLTGASLLEEECLGGGGLESTLPGGVDNGFMNVNGMGDGDEEEESYSFIATCVDYIAKFKTNGTKEWLTTINDGNRPVGVKKLSDGSYRLLTQKSIIYSFDASGKEQTSKEIIYPESYNYVSKGYFNNDGSVVLNRYGELSYADNTGAVVRTSAGHYPNVFPTGTGFVGYKCVPNEACQVVDISKDLNTVTPRQISELSNKRAVVVTANQDGDVVLAVSDDNSGKIISVDKNGKKLGEITNVSEVLKNYGVNSVAQIMGYEDFTIGVIAPNALEGPELSDSFPAVSRVVKLNRDLSIEYDYASSGSEYIFDIAELRDGSLVGVGLAMKNSSKVKVDGDMNGSYMRITAKTTTAPTTTNQKGSNVKNPNTLDKIQLTMITGGVVLLSLGAVLRKALLRR